jgi:hypothetical protein
VSHRASGGQRPPASTRVERSPAAVRGECREESEFRARDTCDGRASLREAKEGDATKDETDDDKAVL